MVETEIDAAFLKPIEGLSSRNFSALSKGGGRHTRAIEAATVQSLKVTRLITTTLRRRLIAKRNHNRRRPRPALPATTKNIHGQSRSGKNLPHPQRLRQTRRPHRKRLRR